MNISYYYTLNFSSFTQQIIIKCQAQRMTDIAPVLKELMGQLTIKMLCEITTDTVCHEEIHAMRGSAVYDERFD